MLRKEDVHLLLVAKSSSLPYRQTISSIDKRTKQQHGNLMSKIAEQRATLHHIHHSVECIENRMEGVESNSRAISSKVDETQLSVMSLRSLGEQIMAFVRTFPHDVRHLLQSIMQVDWRTYQAVLQIQERLARSPTSLHESNIQFTNVLGEYRELPYEYFCQWEVSVHNLYPIVVFVSANPLHQPFQGFLRAQFKNKPGEVKILEDQFYIINAKKDKEIVSKEHWNRSISQGAKLTMSMVMSHLQWKHGSCPRPECTGLGTKSSCDSNVFSWYDMDTNIFAESLTRHSATCHLKLFPNPTDLDDTFKRVIVSEDQIARQQIEEDLRLYGRRPEPPEIIEVDESAQLASLPLKRSAPEVEAAVDRSAKIRENSQCKKFNNQTLTAMDWNSGVSPLDAWLNQSTIPSSATPLNQRESTELESDLLAQEVEEMKVFRNVHMAIAPSPERNDLPLEHFESLALGAQIYYRNIMDRYPIIPIYLARRLAQANRDRAERLRNEKGEPKQSFNDDATQPHWNGSSASNVPDGSPHHLMMTPETHQDSTRVPADSRNQSTDIQYSSYDRTHEAPSKDTEQLHSFIPTPLNAPSPFSIMPQMESEIPTTDVFELSRSPSRDFSRNYWIDGSQSSRPASPYSRSSSILHKRPMFDSQEQNHTLQNFKYRESMSRRTRAEWTGGSQA